MSTSNHCKGIWNILQWFS